MKTIQISGKVYNHLSIIVDDDVYMWASKFKWYMVNGYAYRTTFTDGKVKNIWIHREIMGFPSGKDVDHKNHNRLDNRRENLRVCTRSQNRQNTGSKRSSSSKYLGVSWRKAHKRWIAQIRVDGKDIFLGNFEDEKEAAKAYNKAAESYFGEFANLNQV